MTRALALIALLGACKDEEKSAPTSLEPASTELRALVGPGQHAAIMVDLSGAAVDAVDPTPAITVAAQDAVDLAPAWMRDPLTLRFSMLDEDLQDALAALVTDATDERIVDEIAFSIANLPEGDLSSDDFEPDLLTENAQTIYDFADDLPYVSLVDHGAPGDDDYGTTVVYTMADGSTWQLPEQDYYWWVSHPKIDFEENVRVDPGTGKAAPAPEGVHWRRYALVSSEETFDYRDHYIVREPNELGALSLTASDALADPSIYPLRIFVDEDGDGLLVEIDQANGTVIGGTVDAAWTYAAGEDLLLENLVSYGNTNVTLKSSSDVALFEDEVPWGSDVYVDALTAQGLSPDVFSSADLASFETGERSFGDYDKLIFASDQPLAFYEAVAGATELLSGYVDDWGVVQLDLYGEADLSGLGFVGDLHVNGAAPAQVDEEGQPLLLDWMSQVDAAWDGVAVEGASGERAPDPSETAMGMLGWVNSQNLFDNVSEYKTVTGVVSVERTQYPQRILHGHYGNCGENGDLIAALGRAALLPVRVIESVEDHCWDEVYLSDGAVERWVPLQTDWSDGATRIDNPAVGYDDDRGGGKTLSGIYSVRGDGYPTNSVEIYSDFCTLDLTVMDEAGAAVDGAMIILATESYYDDTQLTFAQMAFTDVDGHAVIPMGEDRNYYIYVASDGLQAEYPSDDDMSTWSVDRLVTSRHSVAGDTITETIELPTTIERPAPGQVADGGDELIGASGSVEGAWGTGYSIFVDGRFIEPEDGVALDWYLLDDDAYTAFAAGEDFDALASADSAAELALADVEADGPVWLVAYNPTVARTVRADLALTVE